MMRHRSNWFDALLCAMDRDGEWTLTQYELTHKPSGLVLWIANGWTFFEASSDSEMPMSLSLVDKWRLRPYVNRLIGTIQAQKLDRTDDDL